MGPPSWRETAPSHQKLAASVPAALSTCGSAGEQAQMPFRAGARCPLACPLCGGGKRQHAQQHPHQPQQLAATKNPCLLHLQPRLAHLVPPPLRNEQGIACSQLKKLGL